MNQYSFIIGLFKVMVAVDIINTFLDSIRGAGAKKHRGCPTSRKTSDIPGKSDAVKGIGSG